MDMMQDWKFYAFIGQGLLTIVTFAIIRFNDLRHLSKDVEKLEVNIHSVHTLVTEVDKKLAVQMQRVDNLEESKK